MNESKYPKSLSILLALNLCALLVTLVFSMEDIWEGVHVVMGIQVIVLALGLILIVLPKAKGKRRGMLGILGIAIIAPVIISLCGQVLAEARFMDKTEERIFTLLSFYSAAIPLLMLGMVVVHEGWGARPKSVRWLFFLNLCFLLGTAGVAMDNLEVGITAILAIHFAMILQILFLISLPLVKGYRWKIFGLGFLTSVGPILMTLVAVIVADKQLKFSGSEIDKLAAPFLYVTAVPLNLLALLLLRHGWIAEEAKRKVGWLGNALLVLNLFTPIGLYVLAMGLTDGGLRDEEWLLLVPGWLFAAGLALMALGRGMGGLQPIKSLRGTGEMSFLIGAAMLSVAFLIGETWGNERDLYVAIGFGLLGFLALHHVMRGFISRWVHDSIQRFLFKWTVRGVPTLIVLAIIGVSAYYALGKTMANSALAKYKATSEAEGWHYDFKDYVGEAPADEENFFMAKPFSGSLYTQNIGEKAVYLNPTIKTNVEAVLDLRVFPRDRIRKRTSPHLGDFANQLRAGGSGSFLSTPIPSMEGTDQEVIDQYFALFDELLRDLRKAAKRPKHQFPYPYENGPNVEMDHLSKLKGITQLLNNFVRVKLTRGEAAGAMEHARLQFRLFEASGSDPYLIGQLVHIANGYINVHGLNVGLHLNQWSDEHLAQWDTFLTLDRNYFKQWERCIQGERLSVVHLIESIIKGEEPEAGVASSLPHLYPKQWLVKDLIHYDTTMKQFIELIREAGETGRINQRNISELFMDAQASGGLNTIPFSDMLLSANKIVLSKAGRMMNLFSAARLGIAIERYRRTKDALPGNLSELVPDYIAALPKDIFTGKPLEWEHNGSPRYKIATEELASSSWTYDAVLAAIQAGDLDQLKAYTEGGWSVTKPGKEESPDEDPGMAGLMPGMGIFGGPRKIDFNASETEILTQQNALHHAVHSGNPELVQWLIEHGLDANATATVWITRTAGRGARDRNGRHDGHDSIAGHDGNGWRRQIVERTVLEFAVSEQDAEMVTELLDAGVLPIEADKEPESPDTPATPPGMGLPGMMGGMPGMMPGMMNPYGMMGMGMPGMGMPFPESPTAFELANAEILPLLLAKVPESLMPKASRGGRRRFTPPQDLGQARPRQGPPVDRERRRRQPPDPPARNRPRPSLAAWTTRDRRLAKGWCLTGMGMPPGGMNPYGMGMPPGEPGNPAGGMNPYGMDGMEMPGMEMMGMGMTEDTNKVELAALSVVSQAARDRRLGVYSI